MRRPLLPIEVVMLLVDIGMTEATLLGSVSPKLTGCIYQTFHAILLLAI